MADTGSDPLTAKLTEISVRNEDRIRWARYTEHTVENHVAEGDVRRLLKAVDAAAKLATDWQEAAATKRRIAAGWNNPHYTVPLNTEALHLEEHAEALRSAILAGLAGKGKADG